MLLRSLALMFIGYYIGRHRALNRDTELADILKTANEVKDEISSRLIEG